jgi:SEL1 protein
VVTQRFSLNPKCIADICAEGKGQSRETPELDGRKAEGKSNEGLEHAYEADDDEGGPWYFGRAKDDFKRRQGSPRPPPGDEDPIQWARQRRDAERERDSDFGPDDYFDGAIRGNREDGEEDDFAETMVLVLICLIISVLLYVRTRIVERMRREQGNEQNQERREGNANGGVFPPPGDPARQDWAILR